MQDAEYRREESEGDAERAESGIAKSGIANSGIARYFQAIQSLQQKVLQTHRKELDAVAAKMVDTIREDGRIFLFGTGHSHMLAEEGFFRAGGLAPVVPILSSALMLHENVAFGSQLERKGGLAATLLDRYAPRPGEMIFIFSNSGVNHLPVEMAQEAKKRSLFVVSVSSLAYAQVAPLSAVGRRLDQMADVSLDNGGRPGDGLVVVDGLPWRVGPTSTIIGAFIWNALVVETAARLQAAGEPVPVFASLNMDGAAAHNEALLEKWHARNPHL